MKTKEEIEKIENLTDLFDAWKEDQKKECDTSCEKTFPKKVNVNNDYKANFCPDGFLNDKNKDDIDILFICRESNTDGKYKENNPFWMKKVVNVKSENPSKCYGESGKISQSKYFNCLLALSNDGNLQNCAYMNINKRGGISSCNMTRLVAYYDKYEDYILKEIKLIKPKKIVILGKLPERIKEGLKACGKDIGKDIYLYPYHPCVYRKSALKPLEELKYPPNE